MKTGSISTQVECKNPLFLNFEEKLPNMNKVKSVNLQKLASQDLTPREVYNRRVKKLVDQGRLSMEDHPLKVTQAKQ